MTPALTRDFDEARLICHAETVALAACLRQRLMTGASAAIPRWEPDRWPMAESHNCYNFAVNNKAVPTAFPGMFAPDPAKPCRYYFDTRTMHKDVHEGALKDGLTHLGEHFLEACRTQDMTPVALFMREPAYIDFHWMALRRRGHDFFWAHVPGSQAAASRLYKNDSIFETAMRQGYSLFGGYYGVSASALTARRPA